MKLYVSMTWREPSREGGGDRAMLIIGTEEEIAGSVATQLVHALRYNQGPITLTPIHPHWVQDLTDEQ